MTVTPRTSTLQLRRLTAGDEDQVREAERELAADGFEFLAGHGGRPFAEQLAALDAEARGTDLPAGRVPATFLVGVVDGVIVGRVSVRHRLNAWLAQHGGHIGYAVRPAYRRQGHATALLRAGLAHCADLGIDRALVTCADTNVASARTIERCGGVLQDVIDRHDNRPLRRYLVPTALLAVGSRG
ncbi:GNAT family N-acetyltransferase [Cellulomonas sp. SLBN-39]|uniref:GNAT family N-acetyltransferase n=1 Tax=Cellulomonas sp. SLBN-39 TaxID=2768446 RepID=UPI0011545FD0|nr:GNAT family N-acetyltransferase [Cellulomonas sp. SLBN-39]TQL02059.1 putative acetyltransferase [Cellulomonas sp. SLBN-39]